MRFETRLYWRLSSLPELGVLSPAQRETLLRRCAGWRFALRLWLRSVVLGLIAGPAATGLLALFLGSVLLWLALPAVPLAVLATYQLQMRIIRVDLRRYLREAARREGVVAVCLGCGYDLRGIRGEICPECGARLPRQAKL